ncbi:SURF1 family protein [Pseudoxanthomonas dokdonensis]|uniref:SURF1-like protein n=1 Tax=Pseudoxanthomonas dokdonensis TaxID=344882 RepID=A0A0R0CWU4_9GAMM|nr:SURF1 family protein [Pseudoxanthomonas dokdonensis]KRG70510.1 hypothetical protein ABB29_05365 [Pseudoxanthomonas dokdonensis]
MTAGAPRRGRRRGLLALFASALLLAFAGFTALGVWQLQRLAWKHDLIARVDARIHAPAVAAPARDRWAGITAQRDEYRRVHLSGHWLQQPATRTLAVTELGGGSWELLPLRTDAGDYVLINRGFVPTGQAGEAPPSGRVELQGLLRISEPGGGFLRRNRPASGRWYSRDVAAIAAAYGLPAGQVAPYFVDADASAPVFDGQWPRAGMTVVRFRDHHLQYALTWFALALLSLLAGGYLLASERRLRHHGRHARGHPPR